MFDRQRGWAIGGFDQEVPHVLRTDDGGQTWFDFTPPEQLPFEAFFAEDQVVASFLDPETAWVGYYRYGGPSPIWRTASGGESWDRSWALSSNYGIGVPYSVMRFIDRQHGWLYDQSFFGAGSTAAEFFRTEDGGTTWDLELDQSQEWNREWLSSDLVGLEFADVLHGWAASQGHVTSKKIFYQTDDGGRSWNVRDLPSPSPAPEDLDFTACNIVDFGFFAGGRGLLVLKCPRHEAPPHNFLYTTQDGGQTWQTKRIVGDYYSVDAEFLGPNLIYLLGGVFTDGAETGDLLRTDDGGQSWQDLGQLPSAGNLHFADEQFGWFLSSSEEEQLVMRTSDGGVTWQRLEPVTAAVGETARWGTTPPTIDLPAELAGIEPGPMEVLVQVPLERPTALSVSPNGTALAVGQANGRVTEWDLDPESYPAVLTRHADWVYNVAYSPDGVLASASKDGTVKVWNRFASTYQWTTLRGHAGEVTAVAYSPDGSRLASASEDGTVRLWEADGGLDEVGRLQGHDGWVWDVTFSPDGTLLASGSEDRTARLWDVDTGALIQTLEAHTSTVSGVAFSPDGSTLATASWDGTVRLWDVSSGSVVGVLSGHTDWIYDVAFSPAGDLMASASADGAVILWDPVEGSGVAILEHGRAPVRKLAFTSDGRLLVTIADDGWIRFWGGPG